MARSSSYDFSLNRDNIANAAFRLLGVIGEDQTASSTRLSQAGQALNMMIKLWQADGIALWKNEEMVLVPQRNVVKYSVGPSGSSYCSLSSIFVKTEIATTVTASGTTINHDTGPSVSTGFDAGMEMDSGYMHWSNIATVPNTTSFTVDTGVSAQCSVDNHVYLSTDWTPPRPLEIIQAWSRDKDSMDTPIEVVSIADYRLQANKTTEGRPNTLAWEPSLDNITIYLWPEPDDMKELVYMVCKLPFQDFDAAGDDPDFPPEWTEALVYNLAVRLAAEYGRTPSDLVTAMALSSYDILKGFSQEEVSVKFAPKRREYI